MGRLRATLASSAIDQQIQGHVSTAERALRSALLLCRQARTNPEQADKAWQVSRVRRDIERCLGALSGVRTVASPYAEEPVSELVPRKQPEPVPPPETEPEGDEEVVVEPAADPQQEPEV